jgi:hypothetical protein
MNNSNIVEQRTKGEWKVYELNKSFHINCDSKHIASLTRIDLPDSEANAVFICKAVNEYDKLKLAAKLLEELTPQGSEFYNDPQYCFDWVKEQLRSVTKQILPFKQKADKLIEVNKVLLEALKNSQITIENLINATPTGETRNVLTYANIKCLEAINIAEAKQ